MSATTRTPRAGSVERAFCRPERQETSFYWSGSENHAAPRIDYWTCRTSSCGHLRIAMADLPDAMGLVSSTVSKMIRGTGTVNYRDERSIDYDDLVDEGRELLWALYVKWNPTRNASFTSYASHYLPLRLVRWWRRRFGADGNKPLGHAVSLDTDPSGDGPGGGPGVALGSWGRDPAEGDGLVVRQLVARVDRRALRLAAGNVRDEGA